MLGGVSALAHVEAGARRLFGRDPHRGGRLKLIVGWMGMRGASRSPPRSR